MKAWFGWWIVVGMMIEALFIVIWLFIKGYWEERRKKKEFLEWGKNAQLHQQEYSLEFRLREDMAKNRKEVVNALEFWERIWTRKTKNLQLLMDYLGLEVREIEAKSVIVKKKRGVL